MNVAQSEFTRRHPHPFLLDIGLDAATTGATFNTVAARNRHGAPPLGVLSGVTVLPVRKGVASPYADRVSVGRTRRNDVQIKHPSVSKFHAYFTDSDGDWYLTDADSKNGTRVDGMQLLPGELTPISDGCLVEFGDRCMRAHMVEQLYNMLIELNRVGITGQL